MDVILQMDNLFFLEIEEKVPLQQSQTKITFCQLDLDQPSVPLTTKSWANNYKHLDQSINHNLNHAPTIQATTSSLIPATPSRKDHSPEHYHKSWPQKLAMINAKKLKTTNWLF